MAASNPPGPVNPPTGPIVTPPRTPGPWGWNDQGDPNTSTWLGDTPGPLGVLDAGDPSLPPFGLSPWIFQLPNGTPVSAGSDGQAAKAQASASCPAPLAARADDGEVDIDWSFISEREGGQKLNGYVPAASQSKSGVTIGTGIDLGARGEGDIDKLGITAELKKKLKPYCGKQAKAAQDYLKDHPLTVTEAEATALDKAVKQPLVDTLVANYNAAVDLANKKDNCTRVHFEKLPQSVQTAVASASFQYGSLSTATPNFWKQVTEQRWQDAVDNLKKFGDAYPTRRKLEAGLIESAIKAAPAQTASP